MSDFQFGDKPGPEDYPQKPVQGDYSGGPPPVATTSDERTWAMLCHLSPLLVGFIGPLVIWLVKKDESAFLDDQGKEALNFQISIIIYAMICLPLFFVIVGIFLAMALGVFSVVVEIIAAIRANEGQAYRYPMCIRLIS